MRNPYVEGARRAFVPFVDNLDASAAREGAAMRRFPRHRRIARKRPQRAWIVS